MISVLVVGCGSIGERHLRCFQKTGRARVTACDANPTLLATLAQTYGVATSTDWASELASGRHQVVVICTPAHLHVPMARQALAAGCHALVEKPLSQSFAGVAELRELRDRTGLRVAVAYVLHSYDLYSDVRDFIRGGGIGAVKQVVHSSGQHFPTCRPAHTVPYHQTYYKDRATGGGAIQDGLTHVANWVESVIGPTDSVYCDCAHQVLAHVTVEDTVNLCARHGDVLVNYTMNQFQAPNESITQFNAEAGSVRMEVHLRRWGVQRLGETAWTWHAMPTAERDTFFIVQANRFLDLVEGRSAALCSLEAAEQTLRFNLAALASADQGVRVRCADLQP